MVHRPSSLGSMLGSTLRRVAATSRRGAGCRRAEKCLPLSVRVNGRYSHRCFDQLLDARSTWLAKMVALGRVRGELMDGSPADPDALGVRCGHFADAPRLASDHHDQARSIRLCECASLGIGGARCSREGVQVGSGEHSAITAR